MGLHFPMSQVMTNLSVLSSVLDPGFKMQEEKK